MKHQRMYTSTVASSVRDLPRQMLKKSNVISKTNMTLKSRQVRDMDPYEPENVPTTMQPKSAHADDATIPLQRFDVAEMQYKIQFIQPLVLQHCWLLFSEANPCNKRHNILSHGAVPTFTTEVSGYTSNLILAELQIV